MLSGKAPWFAKVQGFMKKKKDKVFFPALLENTLDWESRKLDASDNSAANIWCHIGQVI